MTLNEILSIWINLKLNCFFNALPKKQFSVEDMKAAVYLVSKRAEITLKQSHN